MIIQKILVVCIFVTVAKAQNNYTGSPVHIDNYIAANKIQFAANIKDFDFQLQAFEESYLGRIKTIEIQLELLIGSIKQADERLYTLALLSAVSKECVDNNRKALPGQAGTTDLVQMCSSTASLKLNSLIAAPKSTRDYLNNYYNVTFDARIQMCDKKVSTNSLDYTTCVINEVHKANIYTSNIQRNFNSQLDGAKCSADIAVKQALDCSYQVQSTTISSIAVTTTMTEGCIHGFDCTQSTGHCCANVQYIPSYMIDRNSQTMSNPFYRRNENPSCLMLYIKSDN